jgi:uncharacterized protein YcfL
MPYDAFMKKASATVCLLILVACASSHPTLRITDDQVAKLKAGMTIDDVRKVLGRPWKIVEHALKPSRTTHRYVLKRSGYTMHRRVMVHDYYGGEVHEMDVSSSLTQYRELELVYVDGKLVADR